MEEKYLNTKMIDLKTGEMITSCYAMRDLVMREFGGQQGYNFTGQTTLTTKLFGKYNLLMFPYPQFWDLYQEIGIMFQECYDVQEPYYIQSWLNFYYKGDFIDWHDHFPVGSGSYHGFYCVDVEPSKTTYRLPGVEGDIDIESKNNLLVISKSDGDAHRTWAWEYDRPRITIAFDIVPATALKPDGLMNHWIPI